MELLSRKSPRRSGLLALAAAALLASLCGAAHSQVNVPVDVTIAPASSPPPFPADGACAKRGDYVICVSLDPINMASTPAGKDNTITWTITSSGWSFDKKKGIDIKSRRQWQIEPDKMDPKKYIATNKKDGENYKYEINVINDSSKLQLSWDPSIMN
jgi:hypothetical protein